MSRGKRLDGLPVSMVLTSQAHRRRTPKKNRRIPTIPTGRVDGWIVHVSAVDTGPRGSESGVLGDRARRCGTTATTASDPASSAAPSPATWVPSRLTNVMTSNIELYPAPARRPAGHGSTPTPPAPSRLRPAPAPSRSAPRGSGSTDHGLCVLHEGPTYPKYPQPSSSSTPPSCSTSRRHRAATRLTGPAPSDRPKQQLSHPADPPHQRLEMPRHPKLPEVMRQHMSAGAVLEPHGASSRGDVADGMVTGARRRTRIGAALATTVTKGRWWERGSLSQRAGDLQRRGKGGAWNGGTTTAVAVGGTCSMRRWGSR